MRKIVFAFTLLTLTFGCGPMKAYLPIIDASLIGSRGIVKATRDHTVVKEDLVGCYVTSSLLTALDTTLETVDSWVTSSLGDRVIPGVSVDLSACHIMAGDSIKPVIESKANEQVQGILSAALPTVQGVLGAILESSDITCRDLVLARGIMEYISNAASVVVDELAHPDGKMLLPAVTLEFGNCDVSSPAAKAPICECECN